MNTFRTTLLVVAVSCLTANFSTQAARTITVNGKQISTGRAYELSELKNGMDDISAFNSIIAAHTVFVDFYALWCGPCKNMLPLFEDLAREFDQVLFVKVNVDDHKAVTKAYGIQSLPTLISFKNGHEVKRIKGFASKSKLKKDSAIL